MITLKNKEMKIQAKSIELAKKLINNTPALGDWSEWEISQEDEDISLISGKEFFAEICEKNKPDTSGMSFHERRDYEFYEHF